MRSFVVAVLGALLVGCSDGPPPEWASLTGRIYAGVKVYRGDQKELVFEILGGSDECRSIASGRGVKVKYPSGSEEWKDREALIADRQYFVRSADPALAAAEWFRIGGC